MHYGSLPDPVSVRRAHEHFLSTGEVADEAVPDFIRRSWVRCAQAGVPPDRPADLFRLDGHHLEARLERHRDLIVAAEPVMDMLHMQLVHTGAILLLCASDGLILRSMGDPLFVPDAERVALEPGVSWTEEHKGTNGIGTAIVEREPVVVYAAQHYVRRHHFLACSATPVFDAAGDIAAVLDITGGYRSHHSHTLALARMAGRNIERLLFSRAHEHDLVLQVHRNPSYLGSLFDGRIAFSEDGDFLAAERGAREVLGLAEDAAPANFGELFDASFAATLGRLASHDAVACLRVRASGQAVYAQSALPAEGASQAGRTPWAERVLGEAAGAVPAGGRLAEIELQAIREAITANKGNLSAAARQLGIGRATLYRKLKLNPA